MLETKMKKSIKNTKSDRCQTVKKDFEQNTI